MGTDPKHEELMAYLYGELSEAENKKIENWLNSNPDARKEINELHKVRSIMNDLDDKEVVDPFFYPGKSTLPAWQITRIINNMVIKPAIALAAAISLIILTGYLTDFNLNTEQGYLSVSFGNPLQENIDSEKIGDIVKQVLLEENVVLKSDLVGFGNEMEKQFATYYEDKKVSPEKRSSGESDNQALAQIVKQMQKDNLDYLERYMKISNSNQEKYLQSALRDFSEFLADQREEDLVRIQYNLATLKESQNLQKMETEEILATIMNTVKNENKY